MVLGLAAARSPWFRSVAQWSSTGSLAVEFVKCVSATELRAHLQSGRAFSALLVDGGVTSVDRDLLDAARAAGCPVLVVDDVRVHRDWKDLGAVAVINPLFERKDLLDLLAAHGRELTRSDWIPGDAVVPDQLATAWRASVAYVCGPGGTGSSTVAAALAQGVADDVRLGGQVLLADLAHNGEQAMLHDARDVVPALAELVDLHRTATPPAEDLRDLTFAVTRRGYDLLLGLRRARHWSALRHRATEAAIDSLLQTWRVVVIDGDADFEGEDEVGSPDIEERNHLARSGVDRADVVFAVGTPGMKGIHSLVRLIGDAIDHGVAAGVIVPVINRASRGRRAVELIRAFTELAEVRIGQPLAVATPLLLPERRVEEAFRDGTRLPAPLPALLAGAFGAVTSHRRTDAPAEPVPVRVQPGSLATWSAPDDEAEL